MRTFISPEHRAQRQLLICYKAWRRKGHDRTDATSMAFKQRTRLNAAFAIMEASDYRACPILVAVQAHLSPA